MFYIQKGTWGGGAYYLGGARCMWGNMVHCLTYSCRRAQKCPCYLFTVGPCIAQVVPLLCGHLPAGIWFAILTSSLKLLLLLSFSPYLLCFALELMRYF